MAKDDCIMAATSEGLYNGGSKGFYNAWSCKVATSLEALADIIPYAEPENLIDGEWRRKVIYATEDFFVTNPFPVPPRPDGSMDILIDTAEDEICDQAMTDFGVVNFRKTDGTEFISWDAKNVVRENIAGYTKSCAARCFEKAGCSAYYRDNTSCIFIIGYAVSGKFDSTNDPEYYDPESGEFWNYTEQVPNEYPNEFYEEFGARSSLIAASGRLDNLCPQDAFKNTYTKKSQFYCLFFSPDEADSIADDIVDNNTGDPDTPLDVWSFEIETTNPLTTSSQYVELSMPELDGTRSKYRPVTFTIETHVRIAENQLDLGRKRRSIRPRTEDILSEINEIEQQALNFILDGGMVLPDGVEVAVTTEVKTIEIRQTAPDGSVAADCSSGSCQCSDGFIDNGNGCEQMTVEQAATTTETPATTQAASNRVKDWIQALVDKMETVFEENRPEKPFPQLLKKWSRKAKKFVHRYDRVVAHKCELPETFEDASVNFNTINTCRVSLIISFYQNFNLNDDF